MIRLKTASMIAACLTTEPLSPMQLPNIKIIYMNLINVGLAFQIQDDLFDVYGEADKVAKQTDKISLQ